VSGQFPPVEPYDSGMLDVGDGHRVYWECSGNPKGKPALFLHGGPGTGCSTGQRRFFDPSLYCAVLFDQRGCGRSRPLASEFGADLATNTTAHLIADIELLRVKLGVDRWTILGLSWGTTLGLAYAQAHPERVSAMVLGFVTTTSHAEVRWITEDVGRIFPEDWDRFANAVPDRLRHMPLVEAYASMLADPDPAVCDSAARTWCDWEGAHVSLAPGPTPSPLFSDPQFRMGFARLVTHYWRHAAFLEEDQLIRDAARLNGIPGLLINGRYDVSGPLVTAWKLHKRWATSKLHILDDAGHGGGKDFVPLVLSALDEFAGL
jgi:proline iminopeptidase